MAAHATGLERIELEQLRERIAQLFLMLEEAAADVAVPTPGEWAPAVDIAESDEAVTVRVELPGVSGGQLHVALTGTQLRISGEKQRRTLRRRGHSHLRSECSYGPFNRTLSLRRWTISMQHATAVLEKGVLVVRLPKIVERRGCEFRVPVKEKADS